MNISDERVKNLENEVANKITYYIINNREKINLEKAKDIFTKLYDKEESIFKEQGFLMWLIWDYDLNNIEPTIQHYKSIEYNNLLKNEKIMLDSLINGKFSLYQITKVKKQLVLKDIFSEIEFLVEDTITTNNFNNYDLLIGRVYSFQNKYYIYDEYIVIDKSFKNMLERNIYEKFAKYKKKSHTNKIQDFIQKNSMVIFKMGIIINQLLKEKSYDNYSLWQSTYIYKEKKIILDKLYKNNFVEKDYEENGIIYLKLFNTSKEKIIAEIVIDKNRIDLECNSDIELKDSKLVIEKLVGSYVKHLKDEILSIDDLL